MTVPLALDLSLLSVALVGAGNPLLKRLRLLDGEAVAGLRIYAPDPDRLLVEAVGARLEPFPVGAAQSPPPGPSGRPPPSRGRLSSEALPLDGGGLGGGDAGATRSGVTLFPRLPDDSEIASLRVLFIAGLPPDESGALAALARSHRVLVNVEDDLSLCDFHVPAILRRGELALSISTGGASPTLSRRLRTHLEQLFPEDWSIRLDRIATLRRQLRAEGATPASVMEATEALIDQEGWLPKS